VYPQYHQQNLREKNFYLYFYLILSVATKFLNDFYTKCIPNIISKIYVRKILPIFLFDLERSDQIFDRFLHKVYPQYHQQNLREKNFYLYFFDFERSDQIFE